MEMGGIVQHFQEKVGDMNDGTETPWVVRNVLMLLY